MPSYITASLAIISGLALVGMGIRKTTCNTKHSPPFSTNETPTSSYQEQAGITLQEQAGIRLQDDEGLKGLQPQKDGSFSQEQIRYPNYLAQQTGTDSSGVDIFFSYDKSADSAPLSIHKQDGSSILISRCPIYLQANTQPQKAFFAVPNIWINPTAEQKCWILYPLNPHETK